MRDGSTVRDESAVRDLPEELGLPEVRDVADGAGPVRGARATGVARGVEVGIRTGRCVSDGVYLSSSSTRFRSTSMLTFLAALTQRTSLISKLQPAANSALRAPIFEGFTLSCLVATIMWFTSEKRSHSNICTSSAVGPINPSTSTTTISRFSRPVM